MTEKTEPATEKKLEDAREKGQVAQSRDLSAAFSFAFALAALMLGASQFDQRIRSIVSTALGKSTPDALDPMSATLEAAYSMAIDATWIALPVMAAAALGAVIGGLSHVGFLVSFEPLTPNPEKIDPVSGAKRLVSLRTLFEVFKTVVKAIFIGWLLYETVRSLVPAIVVSGYGVPAGIGQNAWSAIVRVLLLCALFFAIMGVLDYVIQRQLFHMDQKMTKDEVKREYKQMEGDPQIKGEQRAIAKEIAFSDPKPAVAQANAVVVNPTHYAVALRYDRTECGLPVIVAKGVDERAALIRAAAAECRVPIIGNPELARALFKLELNSAVPEPLLEAVAIVLRWAEQIRGGSVE